MVASPGIEPGSGASETLILSIVLRGRAAKVIFQRYFLAFFGAIGGFRLNLSDFSGNGFQNSPNMRVLVPFPGGSPEPKN